MENTENKTFVNKMKGAVKRAYEDNKAEIILYTGAAVLYGIAYYTGFNVCKQKALRLLDTKQEIYYLDKETNEILCKAVTSIVVKE